MHTGIELEMEMEMHGSLRCCCFHFNACPYGYFRTLGGGLRGFSFLFLWLIYHCKCVLEHELNN